MGDFSPYFDIILFAMIAAFLVLRLRSVMGRRTGNERRRDSLMRRAEAIPDKVVTLPQRPTGTPPPAAAAVPADAIAAGVARIRAADPDFDPARFLEGARGAFDIIVAGFAAGDKNRLRPLLSDEVFTSFAGAIDERIAAKETLETRILRLKSIDIAEAGQIARTARITIRLVSEQINVVRAHDGSIVDGDPDHPIEKTDFWTFVRDTGSTDPNWVLVATGSG